MWKFPLSMTLAFGLAAPAMAIGKYDVHTRSCADVQNLLARDHQAILRYPSRDGRVTLYDRYVSDAAQCGPGKYAVRSSVPTANGACAVVNCRPLSDFAP